MVLPPARLRTTQATSAALPERHDRHFSLARAECVVRIIDERLDLMHATDEVARTRCRFDGVLPAATDTPDSPPILDEAPDARRLMLGIGLSARGFRLGPIIGQLLAERIVHGQSRALGAAPFHLDRFAGGTLAPRATSRWALRRFVERTDSHG